MPPTVRPWRAIALAVALGLLAPPITAATDDPVIDVTLDTIRAKFAKIGGFPETSKTPSPYLADLFGIVRLNDALALEAVERDLVPAHATRLPGSTPRVLKLQWNDGGTIDFYARAQLRIDKKDGGPPRYNVAVVEHALAAENDGPNVAKFLAFLQKQGWTDRYLAPNPYAPEEKAAFARMSDTAATNATKELGSLEAFAKASHAIYLLPDAVHGDKSRYDVLVEMLKAGRYDWFGIEMATVDLQPALDAWVKARPGSGEYAAADAKLQDYFQVAWNDKFGAPAARGQNPYYLAMKIARDAGKAVYALDTVADYILFRYGEFPLGATTRNVVWVNRIPRTGRGLIFGGSAHMIMGQRNTFQDFLTAARPGTPVYHYYVENPPQKPAPPKPR